MTVSSLEPVFSSWDSEDDLRLSQDSQQLCWIKHDTSERYWTIPNYNKIWQVWDKFAHCWRVPTTFSCQTRSVLWILPGITVSLWCSKMTFTLSWCTISAVSLMIGKDKKAHFWMIMFVFLVRTILQNHANMNMMNLYEFVQLAKARWGFHKMSSLQCVSHCFRCFIDIPRELDFIADCLGAQSHRIFQIGCRAPCLAPCLAPCWGWSWGLVMSVQGCMHAQQQIEIDEIKKNGWSGGDPGWHQTIWLLYDSYDPETWAGRMAIYL